MALAPLTRPNFKAGAKINEDSMVLRKDLTDLRRNIETAIAQSVMSRIFGTTAGKDSANSVDGNTAKPLKNKIAFKVVRKHMTKANIIALCGAGLEMIPNDDDFRFLDGAPVKSGHKILNMQLSGAPSFYPLSTGGGQHLWFMRGSSGDLSGTNLIAWEIEVRFGTADQIGRVTIESYHFRSWGYPNLLKDPLSLLNMGYYIGTHGAVEPYNGWKDTWQNRNADGTWATASYGKPTIDITVNRNPNGNGITLDTEALLFAAAFGGAQHVALEDLDLSTWSTPLPMGLRKMDLIASFLAVQS